MKPRSWWPRSLFFQACHFAVFLVLETGCGINGDSLPCGLIGTCCAAYFPEMIPLACFHAALWPCFVLSSHTKTKWTNSAEILVLPFSFFLSRFSFRLYWCLECTRVVILVAYITQLEFLGALIHRTSNPFLPLTPTGARPNRSAIPQSSGSRSLILRHITIT